MSLVFLDLRTINVQWRSCQLLWRSNRIGGPLYVDESTYNSKQLPAPFRCIGEALLFSKVLLKRPVVLNLLLIGDHPLMTVNVIALLLVQKTTDFSKPITVSSTRVYCKYLIQKCYKLMIQSDCYISLINENHTKSNNNNNNLSSFIFLYKCEPNIQTMLAAMLFLKFRLRLSVIWYICFAVLFGHSLS